MESERLPRFLGAGPLEETVGGHDAAAFGQRAAERAARVQKAFAARVDQHALAAAEAPARWYQGTLVPWYRRLRRDGDRVQIGGRDVVARPVEGLVLGTHRGGQFLGHLGEARLRERHPAAHEFRLSALGLRLSASITRSCERRKPSRSPRRPASW